ncbi:MAG: alkaline phosphatase D family protein [Burkholderiaceae bacterium]
MRTCNPLRREFIDHLGRRAAAIALTQLFGAARARTAPAPSGVGVTWERDPYTLGVASGMPRPNSVVLWTRLAPQPHAPGGGLPALPIEVTWELARDDRFARGLRTGAVTARPEHAHSVHVEVDALDSATAYFYRFRVGDAVSPTGRTRTAPAADARVERLRIALASCQHYEQGHYTAHREIARRDLDFVLFVGDYIYESSNPRLQLRRHEGPPPLGLDAYRARHATYKLDPDLQAAHAAHPWVLTWDDHEVENDYGGDQSPSGLTPAAFLQRRAAAYQAYFEHLPVAPSMAPQAAAMRIHDRYVWGDLAELWTLDNRQFRDPLACAPGSAPEPGPLTGCEPIGAAGRSRFGRVQEGWLSAGLAASTRRWRLLGQGSQVSPTVDPLRAPPRINLDGWDGYPAARDRLLAAIAKAGPGNVLCLGGDVHRNVAAQLRAVADDPRSPIVAGEFVCTSITSRSAAAPRLERMLAAHPDIVHARGDERGYALLEIDRRQARCDFRTTPSPAADGAALTTQARYAVDADRPGVHAE